MYRGYYLKNESGAYHLFAVVKLDSADTTGVPIAYDVDVSIKALVADNDEENNFYTVERHSLSTLRPTIEQP